MFANTRRVRLFEVRPCLEALEDRCLLSANVQQTNLVSDLPGVAQVKTQTWSTHGVSPKIQPVLSGYLITTPAWRVSTTSRVRVTRRSASTTWS